MPLSFELVAQKSAQGQHRNRVDVELLAHQIHRTLAGGLVGERAVRNQRCIEPAQALRGGIEQRRKAIDRARVELHRFDLCRATHREILGDRRQGRGRL